jgi:transcriptional regulator with XRE-family HTH domain
MPKYIELRRLLVQTRNRVGLSQMALAKRLGRPQSYVSKFERGERRLDVVEFFEVVDALGVDGFKLLKTLLAG